MPQKSNKKKKGGVRKQVGARYAIPPLSPVATRSKTVEGNKNNSATPTSDIVDIESQKDDPSAVASAISSVVSHEIHSLELKWDARMARLENNMRAALSQPHRIVDPTPPPDLPLFNKRPLLRGGISFRQPPLLS